MKSVPHQTVYKLVSNGEKNLTQKQNKESKRKKTLIVGDSIIKHIDG